MGDSTRMVGYLTTAEAAECLGLSTQFLEQDRTTRRHQVPYFKFGANVRYRIADLDTWADCHRFTGNPL